jgi:hypothetical protein
MPDEPPYPGPKQTPPGQPPKPTPVPASTPHRPKPIVPGDDYADESDFLAMISTPNCIA